MRISMKMFLGMSAVALIGLSSTIASAGNLGLVQNGDMELESRFSPHGTPGADTPAGVPDAWGHSGHTGWSNPGDPVAGGVGHSMRLSDFNGAIGGIFNPPLVDATLSMEEGRSFVNVLNHTSVAGETLNVQWSWAYDITSTATTAGDQFSATIRLSQAPDIPGVTSCCDLGANVTGATVLTTSSSTAGAFVTASAVIVLPQGINTFDIIFNTGNRLLLDTDPGKLDVTGEMFVDDVSATLTTVPEPASLALMGLGGLAAIRRRHA